MLDLKTPFEADLFLKRGAIFGSSDQIQLGWGASRAWAERPSGPAFYSNDFFLQNDEPWIQFEHNISLKKEDLNNYFSTTEFLWNWKPSREDLFKEKFYLTIDSIAKNEIKKAVPYVFETSNQKVDSTVLSSMIASVLLVDKGFIYGIWGENRGMLGVSPEILIQQNDQNSFTTMALAGTCTLEKFQENPKLFLEDEKEVREHEFVVEDIVHQLKEMGDVQRTLRDVRLTPHLVHMWTGIELVNSKASLDQLIKGLHPTPALGCLPRTSSIMSEFNEIEPRGQFGAPFGFSKNENSANVIVAIRNISWSEEGAAIGSGCGVVEESQFNREWSELAEKRKSVKKMLGVL